MGDVVLYFMLMLLIAGIIAGIFMIDPREIIYDFKDEDYQKWENFKKNFWK